MLNMRRKKTWKNYYLPVIVIVHKSCPALTVAPSSTSFFSRTPLTGEGTGTDVFYKLIKIISSGIILQQSTFSL